MILFQSLSIILALSVAEPDTTAGADGLPQELSLAGRPTDRWAD